MQLHLQYLRLLVMIRLYLVQPLHWQHLRSACCTVGCVFLGLSLCSVAETCVLLLQVAGAPAAAGREVLMAWLAAAAASNEVRTAGGEYGVLQHLNQGGHTVGGGLRDMELGVACVCVMPIHHCMHATPQLASLAGLPGPLLKGTCLPPLHLTLCTCIRCLQVRTTTSC
jgi:hypothetical protein